MRKILAVILLCMALTVHAQLPLRRLEVTSPFGYRVHPVTGKWQFHNGVDLRAHADTVFSIMDGVVLQTGYDTISGIYIRIAHRDSIESVYAHLSVPLIFPGQAVAQGQIIAVSGNTGRTSGPHLHFSILYQRHYIDPLQFLSGLQQTQ